MVVTRGSTVAYLENYPIIHFVRMQTGFQLTERAKNMRNLFAPWPAKIEKKFSLDFFKASNFAKKFLFFWVV